MIKKYIVQCSLVFKQRYLLEANSHEEAQKIIEDLIASEQLGHEHMIYSNVVNETVDSAWAVDEDDIEKYADGYMKNFAKDLIRPYK